MGALIGERFFLAQVEGREPLPGGGHRHMQGNRGHAVLQRPATTGMHVDITTGHGADLQLCRQGPQIGLPALQLGRSALALITLIGSSIPFSRNCTSR